MNTGKTVKLNCPQSIGTILSFFVDTSALGKIGEEGRGTTTLAFRTTSTAATTYDKSG
jgi:hypothetical protein